MRLGPQNEAKTSLLSRTKNLWFWNTACSGLLVPVTLGPGHQRAAVPFCLGSGPPGQDPRGLDSYYLCDSERSLPFWGTFLSLCILGLSRGHCWLDNWQQQEVPKWPWVTNRAFWNRPCQPTQHVELLGVGVGVGVHFPDPQEAARWSQENKAAGMKCEFCAHASPHPYWELNTQQFSHSWLPE